MRDALLAVNAGSSTIKCALFTFDAAPEVISRDAIAGSAADRGAQLLQWIDERPRAVRLRGVGHRLVHGGPMHTAPEVITSALLDDLSRVIPFAPNHLPDELNLIRELERRAPQIPQVACFDTAFHQTMPEVAWRLPIPAEYAEAGVRKYGFHGLSYAFLIQELQREAGERAAGLVILAHLGNGSSLAAVRHNQSIDTTMGFTPIGGVVMSTRSGDLDPGAVTYLGRARGLSPDALEAVLSSQSGLLAVSGISGDMKELLALEQTNTRARLAVEMYVYSIRKAVGALMASLGGLDTLVFSGGIGEHAPAVRARVCEAFEFAGLQIDPAANQSGERLISTADSRVAVRVIPTDEELMIARAAHRLLASS